MNTNNESTNTFKNTHPDVSCDKCGHSSDCSTHDSAFPDEVCDCKLLTEAINIIFSENEGTPDLTFVEVENDNGESINDVGVWSTSADGYRVLRIATN